MKKINSKSRIGDEVYGFKDETFRKGVLMKKRVISDETSVEFVSYAMQNDFGHWIWFDENYIFDTAEEIGSFIKDKCDAKAELPF